MTINKYLDLFSVFKGLYYLSKAESKESIINIAMKTKNGIWVYNKLKDKFVFLKFMKK